LALFYCTPVVMTDEKSGPTGQASVFKEGYSGRGGRGRGRGGRGGRSGRSQGSDLESRGGHSRIEPSIGRGGRSNGSGNSNHSRHPRHPSSSPANSKVNPLNQQQSFHDKKLGNKGGADRKGRPRSSSNDKQEYYATKKLIEGPYSHLFCSERHGFALSRLLFQNQDWRHIFLQTSHLQMQQHHQKSTGASSLSTSNSDFKKITCDQLEQWWEAVKIVRCHVTFYEHLATSNNLSFAERCPICLDDEMVCPFIAPCGHSFCLPCVLGYLSSVAKNLNAENDRVQKNLQSNNGGVVGSSPVRMGTNRASVTSVRARCPLCSSGSSMVLNSGESIITYKDLRPVVFVPVAAVNAKIINDNSCGLGKRNASKQNSSQKITAESARIETRMKFVKLHRVRGCPAPYLPLLGNRIRGGVPISNNVINSSELCLPDLPDGDDDVEECTYARQYFTGTKEYERVLQYDLDELVNYREKNIHCQLDPREDWNVSMAIEAIHAAQRRWNGHEGRNGGFRVMELAAKSEHAHGLCDFVLEAHDKESRTEGAQINPRNDIEAKAIGGDDGAVSVENEQYNNSLEQTHHGRQKLEKSALLNPGSAYLHHSRIASHSSENIQESIPKLTGKPVDELLYYQSSDGQLCFLSGIDVALLMNEFSLHNCDDGNEDNRSELDAAIDEKSVSPSCGREKTPKNKRDRLPLPDELTASVIAIEHVVVTPSLVKRKPFLSHVPMNSTVSFVEIDWYSGGDDRNKPMLSRSTLSKFRGELQRRKSERIQAAKVERKADMAAKAKSLNDERRRREDLLGPGYIEGGGRQIIDPDDEFFQITDSSNQTAEPIFKFNQVCAEGGLWPELASATGTGYDISIAGNLTMPSSSTLVSRSPSKIPATSPWGTRKLVGAVKTNTSHSNDRNLKSPSDGALRNLSGASLSSQRNSVPNTLSTKKNKTSAPPSRPNTGKDKGPWGL